MSQEMVNATARMICSNCKNNITDALCPNCGKSFVDGESIYCGTSEHICEECYTIAFDKGVLMTKKQNEHKCIFGEYGGCSEEFVQLQLGDKEYDICNTHVWRIFLAIGELEAKGDI